jgi:hypothetical protein
MDLMCMWLLKKEAIEHIKTSGKKRVKKRKRTYSNSLNSGGTFNGSFI